MTDSLIAAQLFTLRDYLKTPDDIRASLARVREIGYTAVQVSALGPIAPDELQRVAAENGLEIVATHISYQRIVEEPQAVIDHHKLWNCRHVGIGSMPPDYRSGDGFARFAAEASAAAAPLVEAGLTFNYHNHSFEFERFAGRTGLEILQEDSDPRVFSFEVDTYWVQHGGADPAALLRNLVGRMHVVHLKDMMVRDGAQSFGEVGEGNLDWPAILAACRTADIEWYIIEQDTCPGDPFDSLALSLRNLRAMGLQ